MKRMLWLISLLALLGLLSSCDDPITQSRKQQEAKAGLSAALAQLPQLPEFKTVKIVSLEVSNTDPGFGPSCYLERGYVILGSSLSEEEALDLYFKQVQSIGWIPDAKQDPRDRSLHRRSSESMEIYVGDPGVDIADAANYAELRKSYQSIIFARIDYAVPSPGQC